MKHTYATPDQVATVDLAPQDAGSWRVLLRRQCGTDMFETRLR
jgi:hypothetical protein